MHKYEIIIYWSNEDNVFLAKAPALPGCVAHSDTQEGRWRVSVKPSTSGLKRQGSSVT